MASYVLVHGGGHGGWCYGRVAPLLRAAGNPWDLVASGQVDKSLLVAAGDQVALRLTFRGTHQGEFLGMPATGRTIEYISHEFYRIADGLFAEEWICSDTATLQGPAALSHQLAWSWSRRRRTRSAGRGSAPR